MNRLPVVSPPSFMVFGTVDLSNRSAIRACAGAHAALYRTVAASR